MTTGKHDITKGFFPPLCCQNLASLQTGFGKSPAKHRSALHPQPPGGDMRRSRPKNASRWCAGTRRTRSFVNVTHSDDCIVKELSLCDVTEGTTPQTEPHHPAQPCVGTDLFPSPHPPLRTCGTSRAATSFSRTL